MDKNNNNYFVKVSNNWFNTKDKDGNLQISLLQKYNNLTFMTYVVMQKTLTMRNTFTFTLSSICTELGIDYKKNSTMVKRIKDSIFKMNGDIFIIYTDSNCQNILDTDLDLHILYWCKNTDTLEDKFFTIYDSEIDKLIDLEVKHTKERSLLFTQFAYICKSFGGAEKEDNYGICYPSLDSIGKNTFICEKTILKNNYLLQENRLLLIGNAGMNVKDGTIKNISNLYARPEMKNQFDKYLLKMESTVTIKNDNVDKREKQNQMRKLSQLMNNYRKENGLYDTEDLTDEQFQELNKLELQYFEIASYDGKVKKKADGHRFLTIDLSGKNKTIYDDTEVIEPVEVDVTEIEVDNNNSDSDDEVNFNELTENEKSPQWITDDEEVEDLDIVIEDVEFEEDKVIKVVVPNNNKTTEQTVEDTYNDDDFDYMLSCNFKHIEIKKLSAEQKDTYFEKLARIEEIENCNW